MSNYLPHIFPTLVMFLLMIVNLDLVTEINTVFYEFEMHAFYY